MDTSTTPAPDSPPVTEGLFGTIAGAFSSARQFVANFVELITLEARRAGLTLMWIVALGTIAAIFVTAAWFCLMAVFAIWLTSIGMSWTAAIAVVAAVNLVAAGVVLFCCVRMSRNLMFPATLRQIKGETPAADKA